MNFCFTIVVSTLIPDLFPLHKPTSDLFKNMCVHVLVTQSRPKSFATLWTIACQAPLSIVFPMQEFWSELLALLQGIFLTQGSNLHCRQILYHLSQYRPDEIIPKLKAFR